MYVFDFLYCVCGLFGFVFEVGVWGLVGDQNDVVVVDYDDVRVFVQGWIGFGDVYCGFGFDQ